MATTKHTIEYIFKGNVKSLLKATKDSSKILAKYGKAIEFVAERSKSIDDKQLQKVKKEISATISPAKALVTEFKKLAKEQQKLHKPWTKAERMDYQIAQDAKRAKQFSSQLKHQMQQEQRMRNNIRATRKREIQADLRLKEQQRRAEEVAQRRIEAARKRARADAIKHQNDYNAPKSGRVHVDTANKSAKDSASAFTDVFSSPISDKIGMINKILGAGDSDVISPAVGKLSALASKFSKVIAVVTVATKAIKGFASAVAHMAKKVLKQAFFPIAALNKVIKSISNTLRNSDALRILKSALGLGMGAGMGTMLGKSAKNASDMAESINLFSVAMHTNIEEGQKWVTTLSEMSGLDKTNLMNTTGLFYEMAAAIEMPSEAAYKMSKELTTLTIDVASLFNKDIQSVADNLTSGMRGMSRAVVKYGMDIRATTIETYAATKLGIHEQFETMSEADREILRFLVMMDQASDSASDFKNTVEQPANQLKIFKEQIVGVSREIGRFIVNAVAPALPIINGFAMALRLVLKFIADFLSIWNGLTKTGREFNDVGDKTDKTIGGIGGSAGKATKKLQKFLAPFDELIVMQDKANAAAGGGGLADSLYGVVNPKLLEALNNVESKFGIIEMQAHKVRNAILEFLGFDYASVADGGLMDTLTVISGGLADTIIKAVNKGDYKRVGSAIAEKLNTIIDVLPKKLSWENLQVGITTKISNSIDVINSFIGTLHWESIGATIGSGLETAVRTIDYAVMKFDWGGFGSAVANTLNGFIKEFPFSNISVTLAHWLNGLVYLAVDFAKTFDWYTFGVNLATSINDFFASWDPIAIADAVSHICLGLLHAMEGYLDTLDFVEIGRKIGLALSAIDWKTILSSAADVLSKAFVGLIEAKISAGLTTVFESFESYGEPNIYLPSKPPASPVVNPKPNSNPVTPYTPVVPENGPEGKPKRKHSKGIGGVILSGIAKGASTIFKWKPGPAVPHFAKGGVVTRPTHALIGEGTHNEAVIPLGNSPQMNDMVQQIAGAVGNDKVVDAIMTLITVVQNKDTNAYLDGQLVSRYTYAHNAEVQHEHGPSLVRRG